MKKMKGAGGKSKSLDDARVRFKHLNLLQDFQELQKGTEVARTRLQNVKDKKLTLEAEVRFLRQRYSFLMKVHAQSHQKKQDATIPHKFIGQSNKISKEKNIAMRGVAARQPVPKFESSQKGRVHKKKITSQSMQKLSLLFDLNQNITKFNVPDSTFRNHVHQLDLNQTAEEVEDFQPSILPIRIEANTLVKGLMNDEKLSDMKLSACRITGNASGQAGKRKISWRDQVALRV